MMKEKQFQLLNASGIKLIVNVEIKNVLIYYQQMNQNADQYYILVQVMDKIVQQRENALHTQITQNACEVAGGTNGTCFWVEAKDSTAAFKKQLQSNALKELIASDGTNCLNKAQCSFIITISLHANRQ